MEIEAEANSRTGLLKYVRIARCEFLLWLYLALIFGISGYIYSVSRVLKDVCVVSKQHASSISFIKSSLIMPLSLFVMGVIQKLLSNRSVSKVYDMTMVAFILLFILLGGVLLPFSSLIQPHPSWARDIFCDGKMNSKGMMVFFPLFMMLNEWTSTFIYATTELYGAIMVQFIFLAFVNEILTSLQCARFVPMFYVVSNILLIASGATNGLYTIWADSEGVTYQKKEMVINSFFVVCGLLTIVMYLLKWILERSVLKRQLFIRTEIAKKKRKHSVSFSDGIQIMLKSRFLIFMVVNSLAYYITMNLVESSWKNSFKHGAEFIGENKGKFTQKIESIEQIFVGASVVLFMLSPVSSLVQTHGWMSMAIIPPIIMLIGSIIVFGSAFFNYPNYGGGKNILFPSLFAGMTPNFFLECYGGMVCVGAMKIGKYAFYDLSKEQISMLIDATYRPIFKAVYDGMCGKIGKSMGSWYNIAWISRGYIDVRAAVPVTMLLCVAFFCIWIRAVLYLNKKYNQAIQTSSPIDIDLIGDKKILE